MRRLRFWMAILTAVSMFALAQGAPASQPSTASLDGTHWSVKVTPDEAALKKGEKVFDDIFMFDGGKVSMSECLKYGFAASPYTVTGKSDAWGFKTQQESAKEGTTVWEGEIKGGRVQGTMKWTKPDGTVLTYMFEGVKKS